MEFTKIKISKSRYRPCLWCGDACCVTYREVYWQWLGNTHLLIHIMDCRGCVRKFMEKLFLYRLLSEVAGGYTGFTLSVHLSIHLSVCPSVDRIMSILYLLQYLLNTFHIYTSYQATLEGVLHVNLFSKKPSRSTDPLCKVFTTVLWIPITEVNNDEINVISLQCTHNKQPIIHL